MELSEKIKTIPSATGVYVFKDIEDRVLYVGKAKSLRSRLNSYFGSNAPDPKILMLRQQVADVDYTVTATEVEALLLEGQLIKKHRPRFNVMLKDDKDYPFIRLDVTEEFPRLEVVRKMKRDKARYFGPYPNAGVINETLRLAKKLFPLRSCNDWRGKRRPCLNFHIRRCVAPCSGRVSPEDYRRIVDQVVLFLQGRHQHLEKQLRQQMEDAARSQQFEAAAEIRDQLDALGKLTARQRIVSAQTWNLDVLAVSTQGEIAAAQLMTVRGGKVLGNEYFRFRSQPAADPREMVSAFVRDHYQRVPVLPGEILVEAMPPDNLALESWLSEKRGAPVVLRMPQRGQKKQLLALARENLVAHMDAENKGEDSAGPERETLLAQVQELLGLEDIPWRIECYDISHIQGSQTVASMVVFERGQPLRRAYRRFKIRELNSPDDFAAMAQVVSRRLAAHSEGREGFSTLPQLIVVDGGKGQLSAVAGVLSHNNCGDVGLVALAKRDEELFLPGHQQPLVLEKGDPALQLLQRIRDEAHRFAIAYHRRLREKETLVSDLDRVAGVGPARRRALLQAFGSIDQLREKDAAEIAAVPGIPWSVAEEIYRHFRKNK